MARRVTSRVGIAGVGVIDADTGFRNLMQGVSVVANEGAQLAFEGLARQRVADATKAARQSTLPRNERGDLVSPTKTAETPFPSLYSETYDTLLQKRFLNELGIQAAEQFSKYHAESQADPDQFRLLADTYIDNVLEGVSDDAYETARAFLQVRASQHYTSIANLRAEIEYQNNLAYTEETLTRVVADGFNNSAMIGVDEGARLDMDAQNRAILEAELQLATAPDVNLLTEADANRIRDRYEVAVALGAAQRVARPMFLEANEPEDVDLMVAAATERAQGSLPAELETLLGGPEEAQKAIAASIKLAANEHKIKLALRDMRELRQFENIYRGIQSELTSAIRTGDDNAYLAAAMMVNPEMFRNPALREQAVRLLHTAIGHGQGMERAFGTLDAQQIELDKWWNSPERQQVISAASAIGIPMTEGGELDFPPDMMSNAEGLQTAVHLTNQLLSVLDRPAAGSGAGDDNAAMDHLQRWWLSAEGVANAMNLDIREIAEAAARGDAEATKQWRQINHEARNNLTSHSWTRSERKDIDTGPMARAAAVHFGQDVETMQAEGAHLWQLAFNSPGGEKLAGRYLADFDRLGGISESAHEFVAHTGMDLMHGDTPVEQRNIAASLALYGVLKRNPSAMHNADLPEVVQRGLDSLWRAGFRGEFGRGGFELVGGSALAAQSTFRQSVGAGDSQATFAAMGLDDEEGTVAWVRNELKNRFIDGWYDDTAYPDTLEVFAHDYVKQRVLQGASPNAAMKELVQNDFNQIGWGRSYITFDPSVRQNARQGTIMPDAPSLVIKNDEWRHNPDLVEREVQSVLAERFSHIDGLADRPHSIRLVGVGYDPMGRYVSSRGRTDLVSERQMLAVGMVIDDNGMSRELYDKNGMLVILDVNELYESAIIQRETRKLEDKKAMRITLQGMERFGAP